jgi:hypothetical protein
MIRQDGERLKRARSCLAKARKSDILNFCHLVESSRLLEIQLFQTQLSIAKELSMEGVKAQST